MNQPKKRNPRQLLFQDHAGIIEIGKDGEGFPDGLMLARHQNGAIRNILFAAHLDMRAADHPSSHSEVLAQA